MHYYKGVLIIDRKKHHKKERVIYTRGDDITSALNVVRKIRYAKWEKVEEIDRAAYIAGILNT